MGLWPLEAGASTLSVSDFKVLFLIVSYWVAAATALIDIEGISAEEIAKKSMKIAADLCVYTNHNTIMEVIEN